MIAVNSPSPSALICDCDLLVNMEKGWTDVVYKPLTQADSDFVYALDSDSYPPYLQVSQEDYLFGSYYNGTGLEN